jgi:hypothetical protein
MYDAGTVPLELCAIRVTRLRIFSTPRLARFLRRRSQQSLLSCLHLLACPPSSVHSVDFDRTLTFWRDTPRLPRTSSCVINKSNIARNIAVRAVIAHLSVWFSYFSNFRNWTIRSQTYDRAPGYEWHRAAAISGDNLGTPRPVASHRSHSYLDSRNCPKMTNRNSV